MTQKPVANYAPYPIYLWWKYGHDCDRYRDCDQYRCQSPEGTYTSHDPGVTSRNWKIVDHNAPKYAPLYYNPAEFCAKYHIEEHCPHRPLLK